MINLSIIIVSYNTREITKKCVETILESLSYDPKIKTEIIIVDNASTDGSVIEIKNVKLKVKNENLKLKVIESKANLGFGRGNNYGVKQAEGKYLLFLNSDIEVISDAIPKLYRYFTSKNNRFNFIGGKLFNKDMTPQPSCGPFYTLPVVFGALFLRGDYWGLTRYSPTHLTEVDWVSGACFICRREDFLKLAGFDEKIFMYMEEIDLFYRARKTGLRIGFLPEAQFIHLGNASSQKRTQPILQVYKGFLYFYRKHGAKWQITVLKIMLQLKALSAIWIGKLIKSQYLTETYEKAYHLAQSL